MSYEGKIYKIVCLNTGLQYIGSTKQPLKQRLSKHVEDYYRWKYRKRRFVSSFKIIENGNFKIDLLLEYPCLSKRELEEKEREYIESMECVNMHVPTRTKKEHYQDNRDEIREPQRKYCQRKDVKEKHRESQRKYRQREDVKEKHREYMKQRIKCSTCNKELRRDSLYRHNKNQHNDS